MYYMHLDISNHSMGRFRIEGKNTEAREAIANFLILLF